MVTGVVGIVFERKLILMFILLLMGLSSSESSAKDYLLMTFLAMPAYVNESGFRPSMTAQAAYVDENVQTIHQQGQTILRQLDIHNALSMHQGKVFSMNTASWYFFEERSLDMLLSILANKSHPFHYLDVINGVVVMQADLKNASAVLTLRRHGQRAYSGNLSILEKPSSEHNAQSENIVPAFDWLNQQAHILMDIEHQASAEVGVSRQWIYILPYEITQARTYLREHLLKEEWKVKEDHGLALKQWTKTGQQVFYYLDEFEGKTTLYIVRSQKDEKT